MIALQLHCTNMKWEILVELILKIYMPKIKCGSHIQVMKDLPCENVPLYSIMYMAQVTGILLQDAWKVAFSLSLLFT